MPLRRRKRSPVGSIAGTIVSGIVSILCSLSMIGKPAHLVQIITLFASGLTCGISLHKAVQALKAPRSEAVNNPPEAAASAN